MNGKHFLEMYFLVVQRVPITPGANQGKVYLADYKWVISVRNSDKSS